MVITSFVVGYTLLSDRNLILCLLIPVATASVFYYVSRFQLRRELRDRRRRFLNRLPRKPSKNRG